MKKKISMKKRMGLAALAASGAIALAGCGGSEKAETTTAKAAGTTAAETAADTAGTQAAAQQEEKTYHYKLAMYNNGPWNSEIDSLAYYKEMFPDLDFELVYVEKASASEKINLLISSGDTPDVMQMIDNSKDALYLQGALGSWSEEFFREHAPNLSKMIDETDPLAWELAKYDGENMYSIPGWNINRTYPEVSVWNKQWLDAVGEQVPATLADAERIFYKFANEDPDGNGKKDTFGLSEQGFKPIYGAHGMMREMWLEDAAGNLVFGDVMPEAKEALALLNKWYKDGVIDPEFITKEHEGGYWPLSQPLNKNKIGYTNAGWFYHWAPAGTISADGAPGRNIEEFKALNPDGELVYGVPLAGPAGKAGHKQEQPLVFRTHFSKALCDDTERFGRLLEFIDYVNGSDYAGNTEAVIINGFGLKGDGWEYETKENGKEVIKTLRTGDELGAEGWIGTFHFVEEGGSLNYQKTLRDFSWGDEVTKDYGTSYTNKLYKTLESAGEYKADLTKLLDEGYISIITGEKPIDYFDEMVKLWYDNGGQEMTDEANAWYITVK